MLNWRTWIEARASYPAIKVPVTLAYGEADWSRAAERDSNAAMIPDARPVELERSGHFSCLEKPGKVAQLICEEA